MSPLRSERAWIIEPWYSSGVSIWTRSNGSHFTPSISLMITSGRDTWSSYPSRRIVSIRIDKCNSPRPETVHLSGESVGSTRRDTSVCNSAKRRSSTLRDVTCLPSRPANGELLAKKVIWSVGSSIRRTGNGSTASVGVIVSPTKMSSIPEMAIKSPAFASSISRRSKPKKPKSLVTRKFFVVPSSFERVTWSPTFTVPRKIRPIPIRPTKSL